MAKLVKEQNLSLWVLLDEISCISLLMQLVSVAALFRRFSLSLNRVNLAPDYQACLSELLRVFKVLRGAQVT
jgi:hypothetical protein